MPFTFKAVPESVPQPLHYGLSHTGPLSTCPNHPIARYQTRDSHPMTHFPLKLFALASPKPTCPTLPVPSYGNHNSGSCPRSPLLPRPPDCPVRPRVALCAVACPFLLGSVSNKLPCEWQLSPDLSALPYLSNKKAYVSKRDDFSFPARCLSCQHYSCFDFW